MSLRKESATGSAKIDMYEVGRAAGRNLVRYSQHLAIVLLAWPLLSQEQRGHILRTCEEAYKKKGPATAL